jgi:hypothetical protein
MRPFGSWHNPPPFSTPHKRKKEHMMRTNITARAHEFAPFTLVVEAHAISEFGDSPKYAKLGVTPGFIEHLLALSNLCQEHQLESVTTNDAVDLWDRGEELRIRGDSLRVLKDAFWFEAYPKHADYNIETRAMILDDLIRVVKAGIGGDVPREHFGWSNGTLFYASTPDGLSDLIEAVNSGGVCSECGARSDRVIGCPDGAEVCQACFEQGIH